MSAAAMRAQVTQIEKYNTAANAFHDKYGFLPGDIKDPDASSFGFRARGQYAGEGDGNGLLEGNYINCLGCNAGMYEFMGETATFWVDLGSAHLIDNTLTSANPSAAIPPGANLTPTSSPGIGALLPESKLGGGNYIYVYSKNGLNYYGISAPYLIGTVQVWSNPTLTVKQAYDIDAKIDDGYPQSGNVTAQYLNYAVSASVYAWAAGGGVNGANSSGLPTAAATPGSTTTCYDNSSAATGTPGTAGAVQHYSLEISNGSLVNCALSFRFQ